MNKNQILGQSENPFSMSRAKKETYLTQALFERTKWHMEHCDTYKRMMNNFEFYVDNAESYQDIPMLPVRMFKELDLMSVPAEKVKKVMTSSGTTGQRVSKIFLDEENIQNQSAVLTDIVVSLLGKKRMPMIIVDCPSVIKNRQSFSARGAGIMGFSIFGTKRIYALNDNMSLNTEGIAEFLDIHKGEEIFLFGFTYIIWQYFCKELKKQKLQVDLSKGILIHGGGWKKLENEKVSSDQFRKELFDISEITKVYDYYGMAEQLGSIFIECEHGHMHCSNYSDVIIRNAKDFSVQPIGEKGMMELVSVLPTSYPGHVLLTEDEGMILGEDDCPCGRKGKYFKIIGRIRNAEVRGCSDTYEKR